MEPKRITLKSNLLTIELSTRGAEILSVKSNKGTEFMWEADPDIWGKHAPILFPICGRLKNGQYHYEGKTYDMTGHGFAQRKLFTIKTSNESSAVFTLTADEETRACYPFEFEFQVHYTLTENQLSVTYQAINLSDSAPMYFSCGSHEAYACPEGIEAYTILFEKEVNLNPYPFCGDIVEANTVPLMQNTKELALNDALFKIDALVFEHLGIEKVQLVHKNSDKKITVEFPEHDYLLFWAKYKAPYLCIEPWAGFPDTTESDGNFEAKKGIHKLEAKESKSFTHKITFED